MSSTQPAPAITAVENVPGGGFIVAIDGPSGTGKSTVSRRLAQIADAKYLDTGAMYRVATLHVLRNGIDPESEDFADAVIAATADLPLVVNEDPTSTEVLLDGEDVSGEIRGADVTQHVSAVSAIPEVRENLVALQRSLALDAGRCVVEGRDIGTAVFSEAACKIYMTASAEIRARRRYDQDVSAGREVDFDAVLADVERRDAADSSRTVSPLRPANDANLIDTGDMDVDQVLDTIVGLVVESGTASASDAASAEEPEELVFRTTDGTVLNDGNAGSSESDDAAEVSEVTVDDTEFDDIVAEEDYISSEEEFFEDYDEDDFVDGAESAYTPDIDSFDLLTADAEDTDWSAVEDAFGVLGDEQAEQEALCTVAIVGRPNVGKSTLVNRFIGRREAVVEDFPGVTRDRISYLADWGGRRFWVQDTGGWDPDAKGIHGAIARQAETAMATADVIVFVVDT
ncbi:(d)CMP kinase, partial [Corynebacterium sp.]